MRRVVVTGMGLVTPLGTGVDRVWQRLVEGHSGIRAITAFDVSDLPTRIAGQVPCGTGPGDFDAAAFASARDRRRLETFMLFALAASQEAVRGAGLSELLASGLRERAGVLLGSGIGGLERIAETALVLEHKGPRRVSPFFIPGSLINEAAAVVSIHFGLSGPCHAVVTACASGANAIGDAARSIQLGDADVMLAGGTEAATGRLALAGFGAMRAMSTGYNAAPESASRPWDEQRDGFVLGEGAGVLVLEEREHARARGAPIHAELSGYGLSGDAHHLTAPEPTGEGIARAMRAALGRARLDPGQLGYVNAHATSTPLGDPIELLGLRAVLGSAANRIPISSTKSATGHLLGAAGAVEAVFSVLALSRQVLPPTLNLHEPVDKELDLVPLVARSARVDHVLSNSFGFGGHNASLVFSRP